MSEKLCPDCGGDLTILDGEYDTNYYCKDPDCRFTAHSDAEYELCCDQKTGNEVIDQLRARITELEADRDSESRWAKEYLARAERAEADAERLATALQEIDNWAKAYPIDVLNGVKGIVRPALAAHDAAKDGQP
jgi:hypothetical protein